MKLREIDVPVGAPPVANLYLRSSPNWTAVGFFATLSFLHASIAIPAFILGRYEGFLSAAFAIVFSAVSIAAFKFRSEIAVLPSDRSIRLRTGVGRASIVRFVPFAVVNAVRLTLTDQRSPREAKIELICNDEDIECPPSSIPRQQALFLAMTLGVRLIKVMGEGVVEWNERNERDDGSVDESSSRI